MSAPPLPPPARAARRPGPPAEPDHDEPGHHEPGDRGPGDEPDELEPGLPGWLTAAGAALLHPRTIRALLGAGGGLTVAGGLVWLVSLGVFEDPRVLAASLVGGSCGLLFLGWGLATRTRHRVAGLAAAGLAVVALPLNLWLLHAQGLVGVGGGLWAWAAGCAGLQAATVYLLRDRRFLLAVQLGTALTALLLLGRFGRLGDPLWVAGTLAGLGVAGVEAFRLFPEHHPRFRRDEFAAPLLWGGAGLLGLAAAAAGAAEAARHAGALAWLFPLHSQASRLVAAGVWVAVANGFVSLDHLAGGVRRRRDAADGTAPDEGLLGWPAAVPVLAAAAGSAAVWNILEHFGAPDAWDAAVFAACGAGLLVLARRTGVGVVTVDRGAGPDEEARGPGLAALRAGTAVLLGAGCAAVWRGGELFFEGPTWAGAGGVSAAAALGWLGAGLHPVGWAKSLHRTLAAVAAGLAGLAANQLLNVPLPRKLEAAALAAGAALLAAAHAGRVREADGSQLAKPRRQRDEERGAVTVGLWFGTAFVVLPTACAVLAGRLRGEPWAADELTLAGCSAGLLVLGLSARTRAPAAGGVLGLCGTAAVVAGSLVHRAEVTLGVGLTAGGAALFAAGILLSVLRDRLAALPARWQRREGLFAVLDWR